MSYWRCYPNATAPEHKLARDFKITGWRFDGLDLTVGVLSARAGKIEAGLLILLPRKFTDTVSVWETTSVTSRQSPCSLTWKLKGLRDSPSISSLGEPAITPRRQVFRKRNRKKHWTAREHSRLKTGIYLCASDVISSGTGKAHLAEKSLLFLIQVTV